MTKIATPKAIEAYREKLLTNPATFGQQLRRVRENLRERSEVLFIDRDLTATDKAVDEETRTAEFERIDEQILRVGARIDDLDDQIEAHNKAHPDAELAAMIRPPGVPSVQAPKRQVRRAMEREQAKAAAKAPPAEGTPSLEPDSNAKPAPVPEPVAEETPKAEG